MRKFIVTNLLLCMSLAALPVDAQIFSADRWDQKTLIMAKWSPLFYELNIGANICSNNYSADFIYFSVGYNKPSTSNEWKNYLDSPQQGMQEQPSQPSKPSGSSGQQQPSQPSAPSGSMDGLHAGQIALGWQHYFNHVLGFHIQAGWGFVADFGSDDDNQQQQQSNNSDEVQTKKTFIYNGVPVQAGLDLNLFNNFVLQVGASYMWKEIPVVTAGLGVTF